MIWPLTVLLRRLCMATPKARQVWAVYQVKKALDAFAHLRLTAQATFSSALAWPYVYPWPQRPAGLARWPLTSWQNAGDPFLTTRTAMALICASKYTPVKTCTTA